ncbi:cryptic aminoglycoside N-acetyltransferase AAC(6')-Iy/Iaa [Salmonella bongori]|uniref:cryptic aminoglycoside N-acetyltransferase AAC(6')-Iy/Iaa n=1 Tax=Salmonella bongori TaxID=54736 RepID=UPI0009AA9BC1|nr:cryptic aminoglycoside N-acetyltransferase AAC(6')-Iy/Iaa [Salmonella bongori]EGE4654848.1 cryptic aminoglycoside N-acetyltransferase AAC(6')-Iy/Iaa [Salmonella bongori serovar 40:z35:- str. 95-0123]EGE4657283.1 cryptic aminoglycoside N-acetyltransferase AAC(6')-Iy/Iaa [Salmonella bongori serovar 48:i:- str. 94-0708]ECC8923086.1 cryptic aminoglycoside N-acetyltransferase AAC(6')-Iy/Iaa [Salmonella bongori]ECC9596551.1 cryptic aminoglycoside N-acetyltransferase AAC(6')-Iy/Iaa [Salmonella bong
MEIRKMNKTDLEHWRELRKQLWPGHPDDAHLADGEEILQADHLTSFIALDGGVVIGFADASIRHDYVNGCDSSPVAFLEGIFVLPSCRQRGVAKQLIAAVEQWGAANGCLEMASDTSPENTVSQSVHQALGFEETERVIFYRKRC